MHPDCGTGLVPLTRPNWTVTFEMREDEAILSRARQHEPPSHGRLLCYASPTISAHLTD
jgi:hypothetical protein